MADYMTPEEYRKLRKAVLLKQNFPPDEAERTAAAESVAYRNAMDAGDSLDRFYNELKTTTSDVRKPPSTSVSLTPKASDSTAADVWSGMSPKDESDILDFYDETMSGRWESKSPTTTDTRVASDTAKTPPGMMGMGGGMGGYGMRRTNGGFGDGYGDFGEGFGYGNNYGYSPRNAAAVIDAMNRGAMYQDYRNTTIPGALTGLQIGGYLGFGNQLQNAMGQMWKVNKANQDQMFKNKLLAIFAKALGDNS